MIIESFDEWKEFCNYYNDKGFVELLGLFKYEDVHNNYLNNLLDKSNPYGYGLKPMMYFLELILIMFLQIKIILKEVFQYYFIMN